MTSTTRPPESAVTAATDSDLERVKVRLQTASFSERSYEKPMSWGMAAAIIARLDSAERALGSIADSAGPFRERGTSGDGHARCIDLAAAHFKAIP